MSSETALILGAGQTGAYAAMALRDAGFAGRVVMIGEEAHAPYDRPPLSKAMLTEEPPPAPVAFHDPAKVAERRIELRLGTRAEGIDRAAARVRLHGGQAVGYDRLLIATGGRARRLGLPGGERVLTVRTLEDAAAIRAQLRPGARVVCIGAGVIGLEIASSARARGAEVTVVEAGPGCMGRSLTPEFAAWIEALHRRAGVAFEFGAAIAEITPDAVVTATARHAADVVIAGIGIVRNTEIAAEAGLAVENGVLVNEYAATADPAVFAAGDVAAFFHPLYGRVLRLEAWRHAQNHGIAAGRAMAGDAKPYDDLPWFWTDQHGVNLQLAGLVDAAVTTVHRGDPACASFAAFHLDAAGRVVAATGINAPREVRAAQALIPLARPVDAAALANPATNLQRLVADLRKGA